MAMQENFMEDKIESKYENKQLLLKIILYWKHRLKKPESVMRS